MKVVIDLPIRIDVSDYHEFYELRNHFRQLNPIIKVKEIGEIGGYYSGIAYIGKLTDPENARIVTGINEEDKQDKLCE
jgi:hypothetical protein